MLTLFDWLTLRATELRARDADPEERLNLTGHGQPLGEPWVRTVGAWCVLETSEILGPEGILRQMPKKTFEVYKYRHRLRCGRQFRSLVGSAPWDLAVHTYDLYKIRCKRLGPAASYGLVAATGIGEDRRTLAETLGLLPIEVVLWLHLFHEMLELHGLSRRDFQELGDEEKDHIWNAGDGKAPGAWSITNLLHRRLPA